MNHQFLRGDQVDLRPLSEADIGARYLGWLNDEEVCRHNSHAVFPNTEMKMREYVKWAQQTHDAVVLANVSKTDALHIGNIALLDIDWVARSANFAILIGERDYWQRGIGMDAGWVLLRYAFERLNLNRVYCGTSADNTGMQRLAERLGMKREGVRRQAFYKLGQYVDVVEYGILRDEFAAVQKSHRGGK